MKQIGVIGQGFVGGSLAQVFAERGHMVVTYDKAGHCALGAHAAAVEQVEHDHERPMRLAASVTEFTQVCVSRGIDVIFVCVPTPMKKDGSCDTSIVESVLREMADVPGERVAVVKSTVPPGSTVKWNERFNATGLQVVFCPEFLTEANALDDMREQDRIILGGPIGAVERVEQVMKAAFSGVPVHKTTSTNAEMVKWTANAFLAVKVSYANEVYQLCQALGTDVTYDEVVRLATLDGRLGSSHWKVPGPMRADTADGPATGDYAFGWGGSCLVKDCNAWISLAKALGVSPTMTEAAWQKNLEVRPGRDWEQLKGRAVVDDKEGK